MEIIYSIINVLLIVHMGVGYANLGIWIIAYVIYVQFISVIIYFCNLRKY